MPLSRYACIALVSAAALLFQVAQTRLFSSSYGYHLTYLVISVSLLGVGSRPTLSGVFDRRSRRPSLSALALAAAASALAALFLDTHIDPGVALPAAILVAYLAGALPFVFASWIVVRTLREAPSRAGRLYSVDLAGAAAGSLFAFAALPSLGAPGLYGVSACLSALAAVVIAGPRLRPVVGVVSAFALPAALTLNGASQVDAVEVNRGVSSLMRGPLSDYNGHVYSAPRVNVVEDEARSYIRRSADRYDLILMTVVDSYAALASGAYALSESYLYTAEAFHDYLGHIADHGLFGALIPAVVLSWGLLLLPLRRVMGAALVTAIGRRTTVQALAVGFGFIAAEIVLLQRLTLYLGQPALALAVGLAALLVGAAAGSAASARAKIGVPRAALASAIVVTVAFLAFDRVAAATLAWPLLARGATACVVAIAIGLPLGSVFPSVIASAGAHDDGLVAWAWAVNGAASVIGSILAVVAALTIGFTGVGFLAAACYLIAVAPAATGLRLGIGAERSPQPT